MCTLMYVDIWYDRQESCALCGTVSSTCYKTINIQCFAIIENS